MREFLTTKMRGVGTAMADRINTELGLAVIGSQGFAGAVAAVQRITGSGRSRALTVARTELGRAYSVAGQARMAQAGEELPGLRKQWRRSGKIHSRLTHDLADGQVRPVDEPFRVSGRRIMFPRDPAAPPGETINCGCQSLPWMEEWDVLTPGRREYSARELALDPRKRDLAGALAGPPSSPAPPQAPGGGRPGGGTSDPLAIPAFLRRRPAAAPEPAPTPTPPARVFDGDTGLDRPPMSADKFSKLHDYRDRADLPGHASYYYGDDYRAINAAMREGRSLEPRLDKIRRDMQAAMRQSTEDVEVWRGSARTHNYAIGQVIEDKAFRSWSTNWGVAESFASQGRGDGTIIKVRLPKGTSTVVENRMEKEVTTTPGLRYRVVERVDVRDRAPENYAGPEQVFVVELID